MNFREALKTVELVLEAGDVPLIIGESGIGKTSLIKELCEENQYYLVNIDANLLKEGEIGGLPTVEDREYIISGKKVKRKTTIYATHSKLVEVDDALEDGTTESVLLFIDELNRCEHAVQQELMNLILNREINGYKLSDRVNVVAAMNPSNKYDGFEESDYQVVDMDPAQEDRFVWINMESDVKSWIKWAMRKGQVHGDIIQFISTFPEYLHTPDSKDSIKATPRSWERISKAYKVFLNNKDSIAFDIFYNVVKGNVGINIAGDFINFINSLKTPLITAKDIFEDDVLSFEIKERVKNESHSRLYIIAKNCLEFLQGINGSRKNKLSVFSELLKVYPKDLRLGIMKEIKSDYYSDGLYEEVLDNDDFLEAFFDIYE
ncbi:AAA family ATPase [Clostridium manihotivorum]|uniref:ATP-binding protein n=1 Tax=Clostridium manihotivorum TaxID=2320868 RepID=A0A3R5UBE4_9CLOT|nr:AAA family ATPase [Clostridium manihotivorum]QAA34658.1 ATP-binding protein [Clostridium manihotivorum]